LKAIKSNEESILKDKSLIEDMQNIGDVLTFNFELHRDGRFGDVHRNIGLPALWLWLLTA
jgi:hypothetical protein